jgi:hypothetical protein
MGDACLPSPNVEMFKLHIMMYDNFKNVDDYFVVMAYDNHIVFHTFACLDYNAILTMLINIRWLITCLIVLNRC